MSEPGTNNPTGAPLSVVEAVSAAMADVRSVGKDSTKTGAGGSYKFRGIDAVMDAAGPAFRRHGVVVVPHKIKAIEYTTVTVGKDKSVMASVRVRVVYRWRGPLGDHFDTEVPAEAFDSGDKATAKAMSVAYRTLLIQALTLPTGDRDPDADAYERNGHDASPEQAADLGRWTGEVAAAGRDRAKLKALWDRMLAEWDNVPWSPDRQAIIETAVKASAEPAPAEPSSPDPEPAIDDPATLFVMDLEQAEREGDLATLRKMVKQAAEMRNSELRKMAAQVLAEATARAGKS